jgi:soluble lytic murein transglycosylase-like protein
MDRASGGPCEWVWWLHCAAGLRGRGRCLSPRRERACRRSACARSPAREQALSSYLKAGAALLTLLSASALAVVAHASSVGDIVVEPVSVRMDAADLARRELIATVVEEHGVSPDLAAAIHDLASEEGIPPDLAFGLVRVESGFDEGAVSSAGALGLTQVMPATAAYIEPGIQPDAVLDPHTNLRLGFRYLRMMLDRYDDISLALTAYNRGPGTVQRHLAAGLDPANGFDVRVLSARPVPDRAGDGS